jgi:hypothetical protein
MLSIEKDEGTLDRYWLRHSKYKKGSATTDPSHPLTKSTVL